MKKILLLLVCALFGISANLAAGPAEQNPVRKINAPQILSGAQLQIAQQQPVVQGKSLKGMPIKPGSKAVAPMKALKAPARAAEATAADLTVNEAELAATVLQQNADFTAKATVYNNGTSDYQGELAVYLFTDDGTGQLVPFFATDAVSVTIPQNSSQMVSIPGHINGDEIPAGGYYIGVVADATNILYFKDSPEYNITYIEIAADPASNYILNVTNEATFPTALNQNENGIFTVNIANTGNADFSGNIVMFLIDPNSTSSQVNYNTNSVPVTINGNSNANVEIPYYITSDVAAGEYKMSIGELVGNSISYIPLSDGSYYINVEIVEKEGAELSIAYDQSTIPETIMQGVAFDATVAITNTGADFDGEINLALTDMEGYIIYAGEYQATSIANSETKVLQFNETIGTDIAAGEYLLYILTKNIEIVGGTVVTLEANPELTPILSWSNTNIPASIMPGKDFTVEGTISNAGVDFNGIIVAGLINDERMIIYVTDPQTINVARDESKDFVTTGNLPDDTPLGDYTLAIMQYDGEYYRTIGTCGTVTVEANPEISPVLSWVEESSDIPSYVYQGIPFTVKAMIKNDGATFSGPVSLQISSLTALAHSAEQTVTIAEGETKEVIFSNIVMGSELSIGLYILYISTEAGELYSGIINLQDAQSAPMLSVMENISEIPATIMQNQEFTMKAMVRNDGLAFDGNLRLFIQSSAAEEVFSTQKTESIAPGETKEVIFTGTITDETPAGNYYLNISQWDEENGDHPLYAKDIRLIEDLSDIPILSFIEEGSNIPSILYHGREFTATAMMRNDGTDFNGTLRMHITYYGTTQCTFEKSIAIAHGETKVVAFTGTVDESIGTGDHGYGVQFDWTMDAANDDVFAEGTYDAYQKAIEISVDPTKTPILRLDEEAGNDIPEVIYLGKEFNIVVNIKNEGADYDGTIALGFHKEYFYDYLFTQPASIANGETKKVTFTGTITDELAITDEQYVTIDWMDGESYHSLHSFYVAIEEMPAPALSVLKTDDFSLSYRFVQGTTDNPFTATIQNTGGDYKGNVDIVLFALPSFERYTVCSQDVTVPTGATKQETFAINAEGLPIGEYELYFYDGNGKGINIVDSEDNWYYPRVTIEDPVGMNAANGKAFRIFPNPATDYVDITYPETIENIRLHSLAGTLLMAETVNADAHHLDISALPQGTYLLTIVTADGAKTERFIKK